MTQVLPLRLLAYSARRFFCVLTTRAVPVSRDLAQYNLEARDTFNGNASDRDGYIHHAVTALRKEREQREAMARGEGGGKGGSALDQVPNSL